MWESLGLSTGGHKLQAGFPRWFWGLLIPATCSCEPSWKRVDSEKPFFFWHSHGSSGFLFVSQFWSFGLAKGAASTLSGGTCSFLVLFPYCCFPGRTGFLFTVLVSSWLRKAALPPSSHLIASVSIKKTTCNPLHSPGDSGSVGYWALPGSGWQLRVLSPSLEDTLWVEDVGRGVQDLGDKPPWCHNHLGTASNDQSVHHSNGLVVWPLLCSWLRLAISLCFPSHLAIFLTLRFNLLLPCQLVAMVMLLKLSTPQEGPGAVLELCAQQEVSNRKKNKSTNK